MVEVKGSVRLLGGRLVADNAGVNTKTLGRFRPFIVMWQLMRCDDMRRTINRRACALAGCPRDRRNYGRPVVVRL